MQIIFNTRAMQISECITLADLLKQENCQGNYFAVVINQKFIPRHLYTETFLMNDDTVEIVTPMQGG